MSRADLYSMTRRQLLGLANSAGIRGRHRMTKAQLSTALIAATMDRETRDLPTSYGKSHLTLLEINPSLMHAFWELTPEDIRRAFEEMGAAEAAVWALRIYDIGSENKFFDLRIDPGPRNWYIHFPFNDRAYFAEIGFRASDRFVPVCRSNSTGWQREPSGEGESKTNDTGAEAANRSEHLPDPCETAKVYPSAIPAEPDVCNPQSAIHDLQLLEPFSSYGCGLPKRTPKKA